MSSPQGVPLATRRFGAFQPFWRTVSREDERYIGTQLGFVTYDEDDRYQMTYVEAGLRSDHIVDGLLSIGDKNHTPQSTVSPAVYDQDLIVPADDKKQASPVTDETEPSKEAQPTMAVVA